MAINKRWWSGTLAVMATAGLLVAPATSAGAAQPSGSLAPNQTDVAGVVTLITGDRVTLHSNGHVSVARHPSRESRNDIVYTTYRMGDDTYVRPSDASRLVEAGRLDPELFNVSALAAYGYDDAGSDSLPLLVARSNGLRSDARNRLVEAGARVTGELRSAEVYTVETDHADLAGFWRDLTGGGLAGGSRIWLDRMLQPALADSVPQVGAPAAVAAGFNGAGVTVAVLDSGVDTAHPDLVGKVIGTANFTPDGNLDVAGHGTHVASTIAGSGAASGGANKGVAPGASLLSGKVCDDSGGCSFSAIIAGMEWATSQGADVVNMSLSGRDSIGVDPLEEAINNLTASTGTLFVVSAGNEFRQRWVGSPATADAALAVGAVNGADQLADFSSRGSRLGDGAIKPDITAPGVSVTAARSQHSTLLGGAYTTLDGTSMAAPHVAGAAAILLQRQPTWSAELLKSALMGSADPNASLNAFAQGAGRLAVDDAINQRVTVSPASVSFGALQQDTTPGQTIVRPVTYRNHGASSITLNLAMTTMGPTGAAAPPGMFTLGASSVTVPAGGTAVVNLTTNIGMSVPGGLYSGRITATGGGQEVHTPFGIDRYAKVILDHTGRTGSAPIAYSDVFLPPDQHAAYTLSSVPGTFVGWLPAVSYTVQNGTIDLNGAGTDTTVLSIPRLNASGSHPIHFDARLGQPMSISVPHPSAQRLAIEVGQQLTVPGEGFISLTGGAGAGPLFSASLTSTNTPGFLVKLNAHHYVPGPNGADDSAETYHTAYFVSNQFPTGFVRNPAAGSYATVTARHANHVDNEVQFKLAWVHAPTEFFGSGFGTSLQIRAPFVRTEHYLGEGGVRWEPETSVWQEREGDDLLLQFIGGQVRPYTAGSTQVQNWNAPVHGPAAIAFPSADTQYVVRQGDLLGVEVPLFGDGDGHRSFTSPVFTSARITLSRNGQLLYDLPYGGGRGALAVPPAFGTYVLTATGDRSAPAELSTRVNARWTFTSQTVSGGTLRMQLWTVRMTPTLDANNQAPKNAPFTIPLLAQPQPGSAAAGLRTLTLQYSVNDGATWQSATVSPAAGGGHVAQLTHPNVTGFVSLRVTVLDFAGNALEQEVIRAYRIG